MHSDASLPYSLLRLALALSLAGSAAACSPTDPSLPPCTGAAGYVAFTELMVDPAGSDRGAEWFEVYNASEHSAITLDGATLVSRSSASLSPRRHVIDGAMLEPRAFFVFGSTVLPLELRDAFIDYAYGTALGDFNNTAGTLELFCGSTLLDEVAYAQPTPGTSRSFDGATTPSTEANDDPRLWCDARTPLGVDSLGTPGAPNEPCAQPPERTCPAEECSDEPSAASCIDLHGASRPPSPSLAGSVIVAELMIDPDTTSDATGEWIELLVLQDTDLQGLALVRGDTSTAVFDDGGCHFAPAGTRWLITRGPAIEGLEPPAMSWMASLSLPNAGSSLTLVRNDIVLDEVRWGLAPRGASLALDPAFEDAAANDDPAAWCPSTEPFGLGDLGSPGRPNEACPTTEVNNDSTPQDPDVPLDGVSPGDGQGDDGQGDDDGPDGDGPDDDDSPDDDDGQGDDDATAETCVATSGRRALRPPVPGSLRITEFMPDPAAVPDDRGEWIEVEALEPTDLNGVRVRRDDDDGIALSGDHCLALEAMERLVLVRDPDPLRNGGIEGGLRLPVALVQGPGQLELRFGEATITRVTWLESLPGVAWALDPLDGSTLCPAHAVYGAGDLGSPGEENAPCPSNAQVCLDGDLERPVLRPQPGDAWISEWMADPTEVSDREGEWFELEILGPFDLQGMGWGRDTESIVEAAAPENRCLPVYAGDRVVIARNADPSVNGGLEAVSATFAFNLVDHEGSLVVGTPDAILDAVAWETTTPGAATVREADDRRCPALTTYGDGQDRGTPGIANDPCD